ncbi:MAG: ABC transporter ATP-binding protein [Candidatus Micrarchaeia archaeon]
MNVKKPIISLKGVKKIYNMGEVEVPALDGIDLDIYPGEFVAIMGPSGSGKSTLMNMVGCLDTPTSGVIRLDGINIAELDESALAQIRGKKIGFVFQKFNLIPVMTALENVRLPCLFHEVSEEEREKNAKRLLAKFGLSERANHLPGQLSGGEQQRVAICRALMMNPGVLLADEPTGNLDSKRGKEVMDLLSELNKKEGKTIILVTHDENLAKHAERIVHLKDGLIEKGGRK